MLRSQERTSPSSLKGCGVPRHHRCVRTPKVCPDTKGVPRHHRCVRTPQGVPRHHPKSETPKQQDFQLSKTKDYKDSLSNSGSGEKKALEVVKEVEVSETVSSRPESSNCSSLVKPFKPVKDKISPPCNTKTIQNVAQGECTTSRVQKVVWHWLPDGPWKVDGKLDPNFRDSIAKDWMNRYGGDIHQRRADVLAHFKKDPANLPIRWEQYASEYLQRYQNTQTRLNNGVNIEEEYQQRLIQNHRAITEPLPEELDPIARQQPFFSEQLKDSDQKLITDNCTPFAVPAAAHPSENAVSDAQGVPAGMPENPKPSIPLSDTGTVENADADQPWKPEPIENLATREQVRELLAGLTKKLSEKLSVSKPAQEQIRTPETEISELNLWVRDPILRPEAMRRIMQSERYTVEFDEEGNPISVVEVTS